VVLKLVGASKAHAGALSLANERMEYIRSLPYDTVGTISGIPNGPIPQSATTTLNGVDYTERVLIEYVDAPQDGLDTLDDNGIVADYKRAKVEFSWVINGDPKVISLISNIVPPGIETTAGGGTLRVNVFDAEVNPLPGAAVRVFNNNGTTTIDVTRYTNAQGIALISGAPARGGYEITVTDTGYSTDKTYAATTSNPNPTTQHIAVLEAQVSTMNFQIDELSSLTVYTKDFPATDSFADSFTDSSLIATSSDSIVASGALVLRDTSGVYETDGEAFSSTIEPGVLESWDLLTVEAWVPASTSLRVRVYSVTGSSTRILIPDGVLPGNSSGYQDGAVALGSLSATLYPRIALGLELGTSQTATTSRLFSWRVDYTESQNPIGNVDFTLRGSKTIGTHVDTTPVYKYQQSYSTNGSGEVMLSDLEWDVYEVDITSGSYDVAYACEDIPYRLHPGVAEDLILTLAPDVARTQRVVVVDSSGTYVSGASVRIRRSGLDETKETNACGQVFYNSGLAAAVDYQIDVTKSGYILQSFTNLEINDDEVLVVTLVAS
jgi:hypothetical protein